MLIGKDRHGVNLTLRAQAYPHMRLLGPSQTLVNMSLGLGLGIGVGTNCCASPPSWRGRVSDLLRRLAAKSPMLHRTLTHQLGEISRRAGCGGSHGNIRRLGSRLRA